MTAWRPGPFRPSVGLLLKYRVVERDIVFEHFNIPASVKRSNVFGNYAAAAPIWIASLTSSKRPVLTL